MTTKRNGGRPKKGLASPILFRFDRGTAEWIRRRAKRENRTLKSVVEGCIRAEMKEAA